MNETSKILEQVIIAFLRKAGVGGLSKTQLIKLIFFMDVEAAKLTGKTITDSNYRTDQYGVVDYSIWDYSTNYLVDEVRIKYASGLNYHGSPMQRIHLVEDSFEDTPEHIASIIDQTWSKFGKMSAAKLGGITKELVPMDDEWEIGVPVDPRDIAYEESEEFKKLASEASSYVITEVKPLNAPLKK